MADLDRVVGEVDGRLAQVDLVGLALRRSLAGIGDELVLELGPADVTTADSPVLAEVDAVVGERLLIVAVDGLSDDLRDATDSEGPILAFDYVGRRVDGGSEERREEGLVVLGVILGDPAEVAGLRRGGAVGRGGPRDIVPGLATLDVGERLIDRRSSRGLLLPPRPG